MKQLTLRLCGAKIFAIGLMGKFLNEMNGLIMGEPQTTYERNKLPEGYISMGLGYFLGDRHKINEGRELIKKYRNLVEDRNEILNYVGGISRN